MEFTTRICVLKEKEEMKVTKHTIYTTDYPLLEEKIQEIKAQKVVRLNAVLCEALYQVLVTASRFNISKPRKFFRRPPKLRVTDH
jgi:hypothetical protein